MPEASGYIGMGPEVPLGLSKCRGFPRGQISQLYGPEGSGKTAFALSVAKGVCASGGVVLYLDWNCRQDRREIYGLETTEEAFVLLQSPLTLEEGLNAVEASVEFGADLIVWDFVGGNWDWAGVLLRISQALEGSKTAFLGVSSQRDVHSPPAGEPAWEAESVLRISLQRGVIKGSVMARRVKRPKETM